jgi:tetratricopeptide (TPR) repeat protein
MPHSEVTSIITGVFRPMKGFVSAFIFVLLALSLVAQDNSTLIKKGNKDYTDGLYHNAIEDYLKVLGNGYESPELYFNLGNAYFKANDLASAILYYEKAKKLKPNDPDVNFNLHIANSRIVDKIDPVPQMGLVKCGFVHTPGGAYHHRHHFKKGGIAACDGMAGRRRTGYFFLQPRFLTPDLPFL